VIAAGPASTAWGARLASPARWLLALTAPTASISCRLRTTLLTLAAGALLIFPSAALAAAQRPSLPQIEPQVMCVTCKIPLNVAESAEATQERVLIRQLIDEGRNEAQIKRALVAQYGPAVLALPSTKGFQLSAYLVPIAVVLALVALLALLLPRWRRAARAQQRTQTPPPALSSAEAERLERDMQRFD
jgi:cytochrome c-type biogenesis protein CcmH